MPLAVRLLAISAVALLLPWAEAGAQSRTPASHVSARIVPKIGPVTPTNNAAALAAMLAGPGVTISNATFIGAAAAAGTFTGGQVSIGIDGGVVLSTGAAQDTVGPNQSDATTTEFMQPGDSQLNTLVAPYITQDAAILEFDVTPTANTLSVRFVFASEEYPEFVNSQYNDVFAIFVNGVNCANYGGRPVNVNSINATINEDLYLDNDLGTRNTEMDGLTVPLECVAAVNPNVRNHVKIAIADTSDGIYDTAVFLAAGGVKSPGAGPLTNSSLAKVIEYYHDVFDHFFITGIPGEIAKLDDGTFVGWTRTGRAFNVFVSGTPATSPVCRFFSTKFAPKSSHFYTPSAPECEGLKAGNNWAFEAEVFNVALPDDDGACASGTQPLYRVYNDGMGDAPNHRYTTSLTTFEDMLAKGWKPEGVGVGVIACVPK
ncbi:MAG: choice-of-anchor L domain-containing protein [Casimicrobiaceae bacterium]